MTDHISIERLDGVLSLTISRPDKKNAFTDEMYVKLAGCIANAETDASIKAMLLRGAGETFTSGNDISSFREAPKRQPGARGVDRLLKALVSSTKPIVAGVKGKAIGIGATLLLHCDFVVLAENAQMSTPFANLALVPEAASSVLLPRFIGHVRAFEMFALGEPVCAQNALAWGLANRVVPVERLDSEALEFARRIAEKPSNSLSETKRLMRHQENLQKRVELEMEILQRLVLLPEAQEAFAAFAERRRPRFG